MRGNGATRHIHTSRDSMRRAPLILRVPNRSGHHAAQRLYSTPPPPRTRRNPVRTILILASAISGATVLGLYSDARTCPSPPFKLAETSRPEHGASPPLLTLLRTYFVYGLTSCETIVDHAPEILDTLLKVPLVGTVVEGVVRRTFFNHVRILHPMFMSTN